MSDNEFGLRPDDFRRLWPRALGRIMGQLQEVADAVQAANHGNKQLLSGALVTSKEGVERLEAAGRKMANTVNNATERFGQAVDEHGGTLLSHLNEATQGLVDAGDDVVRKATDAVQDPITKLTEAAVRLEAAAAEAETNRAAASDARMKLIDYRKDLDAHEVQVNQRLAEAKAKAYAGLGFWARVWAVVSPPTVTANLPAQPARPAPAKAKVAPKQQQEKVTA